jgi:hypothetical protein
MAEMAKVGFEFVVGFAQSVVGFAQSVVVGGSCCFLTNAKEFLSLGLNFGFSCSLECLPYSKP